MEWYLPITIIPGVGMLINSTTTQIMALSTETKSNLSFPNLALYIGTFSIFIALILLTLFSFRSVKIRQEQFEHNGHI